MHAFQSVDASVEDLWMMAKLALLKGNVLANQDTLETNVKNVLKDFI